MKKMKKNKFKNKSKSAAYPLLQVFIVIVIFLLIDFWSIGSFENYKKISDFKSKILSDDIKFNKSPPTELFGIKLFDDIDNYLLEKTRIHDEKANNKKFVYIEHDTERSSKRRKFKIETSSSFQEYFASAGEDRKVNVIFAINDPFIKLKGNKNFSKACSDARNKFLKRKNLQKKDFKNKFYIDSHKGATSKSIHDSFADFLSIDYIVNKNNDGVLKSEKVRLSIVCIYEIELESIRYAFALLLYSVEAFQDFFVIGDHWTEIEKPSNSWIRKYRNRKK
jgi:hypothetical protein|tara:strand:- start:221 stop:1057 length:837 start_codon:yes stop_codon:yes gene_type:complete